MTEIDPHTVARLTAAFPVKENEPLRHHTSLKVGGPADLFARPRNAGELAGLLTAARDLDLPVFILGGGSNLLITDKGIRGLVVCMTDIGQPIQQARIDTHTMLTAGSGTRLSTLCRYALDHSLSGLEFAAGIPGTFGGALRMNAGAHGGAMSDVISRITVMEKADGSIITLDRSALVFGYRTLEIPGRGMDDLIIIEAALQLDPGDPGLIRQTFDRNLKNRNASQPVSMASAGCFFKNPGTGSPAGMMIEQCGLKGRRIGGAMVSPVHANYIVNTGGATCSDILNLMTYIQQQVQDRFQVRLEAEVKIEGE